ncbi:hypothetical protein ACI68E_001894 [Malassezia pachydermatis]|uniref:ASST-domain-containing protein n=1 Tax=Malassezia pachydermatis TaxID=77020 RepID=A0A0M9VQ46_9BASI|nr:hypothetical protein Malapachy_1257 [Malassezia pachydermatis]KOS15102.1 hypothetical protein Malapachy_1257 [Malassezia pachydermatis]
MKFFVVPLLLWQAIAQAWAYYVTEPELEPLSIAVTYRHPTIQPAPGYFFIGSWSKGIQGAYIVDNDGIPVYINNSVIPVINFGKQMLNGQPVLTYWTGTENAGGFGMEDGKVNILNADYTFNRSVVAKNSPDLHESRITNQNTMLSTFYRNESNVDISAAPGNYSTGYIAESCFQELDLNNNNTVLFEYCAREGVTFDKAYDPPPKEPTEQTPWDWFHINSVDKDALGNYIFSGRYTSSIYYLDAKSRNISWILGGKMNQFNGSGSDFFGQHHVHLIDEQDLSAEEVQQKNTNGTRHLALWDNAVLNGKSSRSDSRGMEFEIDFAKNTTTLIRNFEKPGNVTNLKARSQGSAQVLGGNSTMGHVVTDYGSTPAYAEYDANGESVLLAYFANPNSSYAYRVYKDEWVGQPKTAPSVAKIGDKVYVSWNGATEVTNWRVTQSSDSKDVNANANSTDVRKTGFETAIPINLNATLTQISALGKDGNVLSKSVVLDKDGKSQGGEMKGYSS